MYFHCYLNCKFETDIDRDWQNHVKENHPNFPVYPSKKYLKQNGFKTQGKIWEELDLPSAGE